MRLSLYEAMPTLVPLTPAQACATHAERELERATHLCRRLGVDPDRHAALILRTMDAYVAEGKQDRLPAIAEALSELLPPSAEAFEHALMLGLAIGLVVASEKA